MSSSINLDELLAALGTAMTQEHVDRLLGAGVPASTTVMCGTAKIRPEGQHYVPDDAGLEALVVPVFDTGTVADLLAFAPDTPARWWLRLGLAAYLGGDALADILADIWVYRTPWSWLRAGAPGDGLVILDTTVARRELAHLNIVAENPDHGVELDSRLTIPARHPQISVPVRAAA